MEKYSVFDLEVVKVAKENNTYQYFICKHNKFFDIYLEIFTKTKIKNDKILETKSLSEYYSILERYNYTTGKPLVLYLSAILQKYNEINYGIKKEELNKKCIFEEIKVYKKKNR